MKSFYTFLFIVIYITSNAQNCNCDSIFHSVKNTVEKIMQDILIKLIPKLKKNMEFGQKIPLKNYHL